jgi:hypothetical protein
LELSSLEPGREQWQIAAFHEREALILRQKAEDLAAQVHHYERLFGADSDWVKGAQLLAQSYAEMAQEHQRLAEIHVTIARRDSDRR